MLFVKFALALLLTWLLPQASFADSRLDAGDVQYSLDFADSTRSNSQLHLDIETRTVDAADAADVLEKAIDESKFKTLVSSGDTPLLLRAARKGKQIAIMPFGKAVRAVKDSATGVNRIIRQMKENVAYAYRTDKVRLMLVTYSVGADAFRWIHVDSLSTFAQTSSITYMVITNVLFSVNEEFRMKLTEKIENMWRKVLRLGAVQEQTSRGPRETAATFLANLSFSSTVNVGFILTLSMDQLVAKTFSAGTLTVPLLLGVATTAAGFTWHEFNANIDEATHPRAKKIARVILNSRIIVMSTLASSAMLLNHTQYGAAPWIVLTAAGLAGFPLYFKTEKIANWLENSRAITKVTQTFERLYDGFSRTFKPAPRYSCIDIF